MRVLIAGGGFAGAEVLLALRVHAGSSMRIHLLADAANLDYRPLAVAEPFGLGDVQRISLDELCASQDAGRVHARLRDVDVPARQIITDRTAPLPYDALVITVGARRSPSLAGALLFDGAWGVVELRRLVDKVASGSVDSIAFAVPEGTLWTLPIYELALLTAVELRRRDAEAALSIVSPEQRPLEAFGSAVSDRVAALLAERGIEAHLGTVPHRVGRGHGRAELLTTSGPLPADRVVSLPRVAGPRIAGLPYDAAGFIPTNPHGLVDGTATVYAAGDVTTFPIKQGGLAMQQADAVAAAIAARAGLAVDARPFEPRLRAVLLTGGTPLRLTEGEAPVPASDSDVLTRKATGRHLSAWLDRHTGRADASVDRRAA